MSAFLVPFRRAHAVVLGCLLLFVPHAFAAPPTDAERLKSLEAEVSDLRQQVAELRALLVKGPAAPASSSSPVPVIAAGDTSPASSASTNRYESLSDDLNGTGTLYDSFKQSTLSLLPASLAGKGVTADLSVVLDGSFYHDSASPAGSLPDRMAGFGEGVDEDDRPRNGFNLREVELGFSAAVDPYFRAWATVSVDEDSAGFEEAVVQTTSLPYGLTLAAGKIKSGIGRLNRQHAHAWDFVDEPLVYHAFFGPEGLTDAGLQLTWLAPTPFYLLFGTEVFNGDDDRSFSTAGDGLKDHDAPRLVTAFVKAGPDLGPKHALQGGLSALYGREAVWSADLAAGAAGFSRIYGADAVYKYSSGKVDGEGDLIVQGEYFYRDQDLDDTAGDWAGKSAWTAGQDGYYLQALYGFLPRWRAGLRWDEVGVLNTLKRPDGTGGSSLGSSERLTGILDWRLTEFSRLRGQLGYGRYPLEGAGDEHGWNCALEWQVVFGQHPAHDF